MALAPYWPRLRAAAESDISHRARAAAEHGPRALVRDLHPTLSWDANSWVHGSVRARVLDDSGAEVASHTVVGDGKGSEVVVGKAGTWTFTGSTSDANGSMQMRLTC